MTKDPIEIKQEREKHLDNEIDKKNRLLTDLTRQVNLARTKAEETIRKYLESIKKVEEEYLQFIDEIEKSKSNVS